MKEEKKTFLTFSLVRSVMATLHNVEYETKLYLINFQSSLIIFACPIYIGLLVLLFWAQHNVTGTET